MISRTSWSKEHLVTTAIYSLSRNHKSRIIPRLCTRYIWGSAIPARAKDVILSKWMAPESRAVWSCHGSIEACCSSSRPPLSYFWLQIHAYTNSYGIYQFFFKLKKKASGKECKPNSLWKKFFLISFAFNRSTQKNSKNSVQGSRSQVRPIQMWEFLKQYPHNYHTRARDQAGTKDHGSMSFLTSGLCWLFWQLHH